MKKWITKTFGILFVLVSVGFLVRGEYGEGILGFLLGIAIIVLPEKQIDFLLYYVGILFAFVSEGMNRLSQLFNSGAKKADESLNESSARATGQKNIKCPKCKSTDLSFVGNQRKSFSVGKAVGGSILFGRVGGLAGFAGKQGKKDKWHCNNCGRTFIK